MIILLHIIHAKFHKIFQEIGSTTITISEIHLWRYS